MRFKKTSIGILVVLLLSTVAILYVPSFNKGVYHLLVDSILEESVPYIYIDDIDVENDFILDTRSLEEYNVSHIPNAIWVGEEKLETPNFSKDAKIIVYCSLGKRSELQGERLIENGFTNIHNLYGGIIEWHNDGMPLISSADNSTEKIHPYSWFWSLWVQ